MIYIVILLVALWIGGVGCGISFTMSRIRKAIQRADICSDDRRFVNDILGIPN